MRGLVLALFGALVAAILIMGFIYFVDVIFGLALFIGLGIIIGMFVIGVVVFVVLFVALFYYLAARPTKMEPGEYKLEDAKGKED